MFLKNQCCGSTRARRRRWFNAWNYLQRFWKLAFCFCPFAHRNEREKRIAKNLFDFKTQNSKFCQQNVNLNEIKSFVRLPATYEWQLNNSRDSNSKLNINAKKEIISIFLKFWLRSSIHSIAKSTQIVSFSTISNVIVTEEINKV